MINSGIILYAVFLFYLLTYVILALVPKDIKGNKMRDRYGQLFRWEIRWEPFFYPFYKKDCFRDGGSVSWHIGFVTIYKWIVHE